MTQFSSPGGIRFHLISRPNHSECTPPKASFLERFGSEAWIAVTLAALGAAMTAGNPWLMPAADEIAIMDVAAKPAFATIKSFVCGRDQHEHPPLSRLILDEWLWLANGYIHLIRLAWLFSICWTHGFWYKQRGGWAGTAPQPTL